MPSDILLADRHGNMNYLWFQERIGYVFRDPALLESALTHASSTMQDGQDNERMEFLGDSVVNLCIAHVLYTQYPDWTEGDLTEVKSAVVSTQALARAAGLLGLRDVGRLGKGLPRDLSLPASVCANLFEAVTAAVYLDGGLEAASAFVQRVLGPEMRALAETGGGSNPKSTLQHIAQRNWSVTPCYCLLNAIGPDHKKTFEVAAHLGSRRCGACARVPGPETCLQMGARIFPSATGRTKKEAEQAAALRALEILEAESALSASGADERDAGDGEDGKGS